MSLRIRTSGKIVCAAFNEPEDNDIYIDDALHYYLRCVVKVIDTNDEGDTWYFISSQNNKMKEKINVC